ncbi:E3 ubiquitin-protein ligase RNF4 [Armadillidium vulgare]|nr:E3 ubiquitin-protein ligase RNF4 [Armadillidium vulgare]
MNFSNSDLSSSQDDLDLPLKDEFPNSPPTNCNNYCPLSALDRDSSDTFISCSPPDTPSKCLNSSPAPNQSPCSHVMSDSPALPIPSSPEPLSWPEHQPCEYDESCQQHRHSSPLPSPPAYQYSITQNRAESPSSVSVHPIANRLSPPPTEFHCPSVSLIPEPLPLTEKTPLLSGDRPNEELHQLSCPPPLPPPAPSSLNTPQINNPSSSQFIDESFTLRLSPSYREPFYSLSPKSELSIDGKSSPAVPSLSSSPLTNLMGEEDSSNATGTGLGSVAAAGEDAPIIKEEVQEKKDVQLLESCVNQEDSTKPSTSSSSNKVLPEAVQEPPCIVDLTGDDDSLDGDGDDDEVEIVSADQPVVFLGRETVSSSSVSRRSRKRKRHDSARTVEETIVIHEDPPSVLSEVIPLDNHGTSLSSQLSDSLSSSSYCNCSSAAANEGLNTSARVCRLHHNSRAVTSLLPHMPIPRCGSREERRQSSINPQPIMITPGQSLDAPIPQDVINDIESLLNDNARGSSSSSNYVRSFFIRPPSGSSGASGSSADYVRAGFLSRHTTQLPSPVEVDLRTTTPFQPSISHESTSCVRTVSGTSVSSVSSSSSVKSSSSDFGDDSGGLSCPICFESFQDIKSAGRSLSSTVCGHIFCTACLEASLKQTKQCPTCRKRLRKKQYHPLYI